MKKAMQPLYEKYGSDYQDLIRRIQEEQVGTAAADH